jgi:putative ABC transport system ATP-binding protein
MSPSDADSPATVPGGEGESTRGARTSPSGDQVVVCADATREYVREAGGWGPFGGREAAPTVRALDGVSLSIDPGEFVGIAGPSGSGKSTLLHLLAGLDAPTEGSVTLAGEDVGSLSPRERARLRLDHVGVVFQRFHLLPSLTARRNVAVPLIELGVRRRDRRDRADAALERLGLGDRLDHRPGALSGGERQRVAIARALVTDPALLVADEPTGELDTAASDRVLDAFERLVAETDTAVVLASHDERALERADRLVQLRDGRRVDQGDAAAGADGDTESEDGPASDDGPDRRPDAPSTAADTERAVDAATDDAD